MNDLIDSVTALNAGPGDVLILRTRERLHSDQAAYISSALKNALPIGVKALIIEDGANLEHARFTDLVEVARALLDLRYPADVFDGSSGHPGPVFVSKLREALEALPKDAA